MTLTPKELQVVALMAKGLREKEAAKACGISHNTLKDRTTRIRWKLNARTMAEATAKAALAGMLDKGAA